MNVSPLQMEEWRSKYKSIYLIQIANETYIFRPLFLKEIDFVNRYFKRNEHETEEAICALAVLFPENVDFQSSVKAGIPSRLARAILECSQILDATQPIDKLNEFRAKMTQLQYQAECAIMTAFPQIRLEEIKAWNVETVMEWLARAEWALQNIHGLPVFFEQHMNPLEEDIEELPEDMENDFVHEQGEPEESESQNPLRELAARLRIEGKDPMRELASVIVRNRTKNYVPVPIIAGVDAWKRDEVLNRVREQLQYIIHTR